VHVRRLGKASSKAAHGRAQHGGRHGRQRRGAALTIGGAVKLKAMGFAARLRSRTRQSERSRTVVSTAATFLVLRPRLLHA